MMRRNRRIGAQSGRSSHVSRKRGRRKLGFQALELRRLLASDIGFSDGFICITGSDADDAVDVFVDADQVMVSAAEYSTDGELISSTSESFPTTDVRGIFFRGGAGDDTFVNDTDLRAVAMGGSGNDVLIGGTQRDVLHGSRGNDVLLGSQDIMMVGSGDDAMVRVDPISDPPAPAPDAGAESDTPAEDPPSDAALVDDSGTDIVDDTVTDDLVDDEIIDVDIVDGDTVTPDDTCPGDTDDTTVVDTTETDTQDPASAVDNTDDGSVDETDPPVDAEQDTAGTPQFDITVASSVSLVANDVGSWGNAWLQGSATASIAMPAALPENVYGPQLKQADETVAWCHLEDDPLPPEPVPDVDVSPDTTVDEDVIAPPADLVVTDQAAETNDTPAEQVDAVAVPDATPSNDDWLIGEEGRDVVFGGPGDDVIFGDQLPEELLDLLLAQYLPGMAASASIV